MWAELNYVEITQTYRVDMLIEKIVLPRADHFFFEKYVQVFAGWSRERMWIE